MMKPTYTFKTYEAPKLPLDEMSRKELLHKLNMGGPAAIDGPAILSQLDSGDNDSDKGFGCHLYAEAYEQMMWAINHRVSLIGTSCY